MCLEELALPGEKRDHEKFLCYVKLRMEYSSSSSSFFFFFFCKLPQTGWKLVITVKSVSRSSLHLDKSHPVSDDFTFFRVSRENIFLMPSNQFLWISAWNLSSELDSL